MISRIRASDYRCFRALNQRVENLQILVGPNGSGKSNFLDIIAFLGSLTSMPLEAVIEERSQNFHDLVWGREGNRFALGLTAALPASIRERLGPEPPESLRYQVGIKLDTETERFIIDAESVDLLYSPGERVASIITRDAKGVRYQPETGGNPFDFPLGRNFSGLSSSPEERLFPAVVWLQSVLRDGVRRVSLDPAMLRHPSPPGRKLSQVFSGSNLPRLVARLAEDPLTFSMWLAHLRSAIPDLELVRTTTRPEDRHRYLLVRYAGGMEVPQWAVSEGTLRLLALTILAYVRESNALYLIEEPENGVHPLALETIYQSLSSVYEGQVILTTHSPTLLALARPPQILCFSRTHLGIDVTRGDEHPALADWSGSVSLSDLFAAGVL